MNPWEKYGAAAPSAGPWSKYAGQAAAPAQQPDPMAPQQAGVLDTSGDSPGMLASLGAGLGRGTGGVVLGAQRLIGKGIQAADEAFNGKSITSLVTGQPTTRLGKAGQWLVQDAEQGRARIEAQNAPYAKANPTTNATGKIGGEIAMTLPVGAVVAAPLKGAAALGVAPRVLTPLAEAISTSGMSANGTTGLANLGTRMVGGAVTGGASAELVEPGSGGTGALIGGLMPPSFKLAGIGADTFAATVRPFFASGQQKIVADTLRQYAHDPKAAIAALKAASQQLVPGSAPTTAAAAGDVGLAGLQRTMQNASQEFASELALRGTAQNQARSAALEGIAGNPGKVTLAKEARSAATDAMRESVLQRAGALDANAITASIERMLADPNNAGSTARAGLQRALGQVREIAGDSGVIDARALYEIRKDIGLAMNGKLQGDAGNLRFARGTLDKVQSLFDDAINTASLRPAGAAPGRELVAGARQSMPATAEQAAGAAQTPVTGWRDYLAKYSELSKPINQMEALQDVLKRVQTGTTDTQGGLLLSAAKLNQILKNESGDLAKTLTPEQLQQLRNLAADLNAAQLAQNAGKASGSNTVQNLAQDRLLQSALGKVGGSQPVQTTLGSLLKIPYVRANQAIQQRLGDALLNPQEAARLLEQGGESAAAMRLSGLVTPAASLAYRAAPLLPATRQ